MSWRFIYIVLISALLMFGWALIINNIGRRRYPTYWFSGSTVFVKAPAKVDPEAATGTTTATGNGTSASSTTAVPGGGERLTRATTDEVMMAAIEGRNDGMAQMVRSMSRERDGGPLAAVEGRNDGMARMVRSLSRDRERR